MISFYSLEKHIHDLEHAIIPQDIYLTTLHHSRIDVLKWVRLDGDVRSEAEVLNRINRYNEELMAITDENSLSYKDLKVRIEELQNVINPES